MAFKKFMENYPKDNKRKQIKKYLDDKVKELKEYDKDGLKQLIADNELHNEIFNTDYYVAYYDEAKEWLGDFTFDAIDKIKEYEESNFGEVTTDLSDAVKVVNMYVYIIGEELIYENPKYNNQ